MKLQDLRLFLLLEILTVPAVILIFRLIEPRILAAGLAGSVFILLGSFFLFRMWKWPYKWVSPTFWMSGIHLVVVALPMLVVRMSYFQLAMGDIRIFGIPGPEFHKISERVYGFLIFATIFDVLRVRRENGKLGEGQVK